MTACRNKASRAVTAALVGALSVGAVPMVAMAATTGAGASMMATDVQVIQEATVAYEGEDSYVANGDPQGLVATTLTPSNPGAEPIKLTYTTAGNSNQAKGGYFYFYVDLNSSTGAAMPSGVTYKNADNKDVAVTGEIVAKPSEVGTYAVVSGYYDGSTWTFVKEARTFTIKGASLEGATIIENKDIDDTTFEWDGTKNGRTVGMMGMDVALDGVILESGTDYNIGFYKKGSKDNETYLEPGTTYTARINGLGDYDGQWVEVDFTLQPLNLDTASITGGTVSASLTTSTPFTDLVNYVNGVPTGNNATVEVGGGYVDLTFVNCPDGSEVFNGSQYGEYTYKVTARDLNGSAEGTGNAWVTGEQEVKVVRANTVVTFENTNADADPSVDGYQVDISKDKPSYFDIEKVTPSAGDWDDVTFTVAAADGSEATVEDLERGGVWYVTASVYYRDSSNQLVAGKATYKVVNSYDEINSSNVYLSLDGKNVDGSTEVTYDGSDWADKIAVKVAKNDVTLAEGTDYTVTIKDEDGRTVDSIVDAGTYTVVVKGVTFTNSIDFTIEVEPVEIDLAFPNYDVVTNDELDSTYAGFFGYTGEAIDATYTFYDAYGDEVEVPASAFKVTYQNCDEDPDKDVELKELGNYTAQFADATVNDNWDMSGAHFAISRIVVSDQRVFVDVPNGEYYTQAVYTANEQGYIFGMNGTNVFAPDSSMSRGQMVCMLYRMAGGEPQGEDWTASAIDKTYLSEYSDVQGDEFFAQALVWATKAGVVNGYEDGRFGAADDVTVEQYVTMLARYAKVVGNYEAVDADAVLGGVSDGSKVSEFAEDAVAWAVDSGYLAQGGADVQPQSPVSRGRAVTIAVRYQPEQADIIAPNTPNI